MPQDPRSPRIIVFSKVTPDAYRHGSIETGTAALERLATDSGLEFEATEDAGAFTDANLAGFGAVVWLHTSGEVLDAGQQAAFRRFVSEGGGYVGIHAATCAMYDWGWYGDLAGTWFEHHPDIQPATVHVPDRDHPSTAHLPEVWRRTDEWYNFTRPPRDGVRVLITVDESTYEGGRMGDPHPLAWCHGFEGGRSFYTAMGHTDESYAEEPFLDHILGGIRWALHHA